MRIFSASINSASYLESFSKIVPDVHWPNTDPEIKRINKEEIKFFIWVNLKVKYLNQYQLRGIMLLLIKVIILLFVIF